MCEKDLVERLSSFLFLLEMTFSVMLERYNDNVIKKIIKFRKAVDIMTMVPMYKICPICKKRYAWNPDVGRFFCPSCKLESTQKVFQTILKIIKK